MSPEDALREMQDHMSKQSDRMQPIKELDCLLGDVNRISEICKTHKRPPMKIIIEELDHIENEIKLIMESLK